MSFINKIIISITALILSFIAGWVFCYKFKEPKVVTIIQKEIEYNTIKKDPYKIPYTESMEDLNCFYNSFPTLEIKNIGGDEYIQTASLCERKWHRQTTIRQRDSPHNMVIAGLFFDSEMRLGFKTEYYRFYGKFGFGGGLSFTQGYGQINGGLLFLW